MFKLFKNISIYTIGNILNKGVMFLLLPLYTRVLQPADYGKLELVYLIGSVLAMLYGLSVQNGYNRIFFFNKETKFRKTLFSTGQTFNLFCSILFAGVIIGNANLLANKIFNFDEGAYFLKLIAVITIIEVMKHIPFNNLRNRQKAKTYVIMSVIKLIIITSFTVYFVAFARMGVAGVLYAKIIGGSITLLLLYYITRHQYSFGFSIYQLKLMLGFSVFLIPVNLSSLIFNMSNRFFLQEHQTLDDVGLYSLGAKLAGIIPFLFIAPVQKAFNPYLYEQIDSPEKCKKTLADFARMFFVGLSVAALTISLFSRELIIIMSDQNYHGSHNIVFILAVSHLLLGLGGTIVMGIHVARKTWIVAMIWPIAAIANIAFNIWLIPIYGRIGAAIATMLSGFIITLLYLFALHKVYPVKFNYLSFFKVLGLMLLFNYAGTLIVLPVIPSILLKALLLAVFVILLYYAGIFEPEEIEKVKNFILKKKKKPKKG